MRPSAAARPAFFAAAASPFFRSTFSASSMLPFVSVRADLQSRIPAPVFSRSSLMRAVVISIFVPLMLIGLVPPDRLGPARLPERAREKAGGLRRFRSASPAGWLNPSAGSSGLERHHVLGGVGGRRGFADAGVRRHRL